jgi:hypothetical protein
MIKNYRIHLIKDAEKEVDPKMRALFNLNRGTSIHVSNSIIKPEIYKYSTKVTTKLQDCYPFLDDPSALKPKKRGLSPVRPRHRRSQTGTPNF